MFIERFFDKLPPISKTDLQEVLRKDHERTLLEFKGGINNYTRDLFKPFVGFANSRGGLIILGVEDKTKKIIGVNDKNGDMRDTIARKLNDNIEPSPRSIYQVLEVPIESVKKVFLVDVAHSSQVYGLKVHSDDMKKAIRSSGSIEDFLTKKLLYVYFLRGNSETRELTPAELLNVVSTKENYDYNLEYRKFTKSTCKAIISEVAECVETSNEDFVGMVNSNDNSKVSLGKFSQRIKSAKLKNLSRNIYDEILYDVIGLLKERELKKPRDLSGKEDLAFNKLLEELGHELSLTMTPLTLDLAMLQRYEGVPDNYRYSLMHGAKISQRISTALSFVVYSYVELRYEGAFARGHSNGLYDDLVSDLYSYDVTYGDLESIISELEKTYETSEYEKDIDIRKEYEDYPRDLLRALKKVMKPLIELESATDEVLSLRD